MPPWLSKLWMNERQLLKWSFLLTSLLYIWWTPINFWSIKLLYFGWEFLGLSNLFLTSELKYEFLICRILCHKLTWSSIEILCGVFRAVRWSPSNWIGSFHEKVHIVIDIDYWITVCLCVRTILEIDNPIGVVMVTSLSTWSRNNRISCAPLCMCPVSAVSKLMFHWFLSNLCQVLKIIVDCITSSSYLSVIWVSVF